MPDEFITCSVCGTKNASHRTVCLSCGGELRVAEELHTPTKGLRKKAHMNEKQKTVLIVVASVVSAMLVYPPFHIIVTGGRVIGRGYSWILNLPVLSNGLYGTVDIGLLLIQWIAVLIVGALTYLFFMDSR
jgi:hypothetical protein